MKIASTLTNSTPHETGLPSLLSYGPSTAGSSSDAVSISADARKSDSAQDGQSAATFEAIFAMFNIPQTGPQNLPQPVETLMSDSMVTAVAAAEANAVKAANAMSLDAQNNVITLTPIPDVTLPRSLQAFASESTSSIAVTTTSLPFAVANPLTVPQKTPAVVADTQAPPTVSDVLDQSATPRGDTNNATQSSVTQEAVAADNEQTLSTTATSSILESSSLLPEAEMKLTVPQLDIVPRTRRPANVVAGASDDSSDSNSVAEVAASKELPTLFGVLGTGSNTPPMRDLFDVSRRLWNVRYEVSDETPLRHRHVAAESQVATDLVGSTHQPSELADHGVRQLDVPTLAEQVSAAMQTHSSEIATGQPVEVHLRLDPPELGMVRVHLRMSDDGISVRFIAGDEAVTKLLESQLPDLRQSLVDRGLAFSHCNVSCDSRQQQQSSNSGRDPDQPTFASKQKPNATRVWSQPTFATRSLNTRSDRVDVLA